ncbi:extensin-like [Gopherus evgoodei]|uniref:extensin-like n=1 Tax=Gopherus evgoodei TaxID=1825980 RepID=UPI0011CEDCF3|nr:extensin-like [Gopherus evgoodei]
MPGPQVSALPCPPLALRAPRRVPVSQPCRAHPRHYGPHAGSPGPSPAVPTPGTTVPTPGPRVPALPCPPPALRAPRWVPASQPCRAHPRHYGPHAGSPRPSRAVPTPATTGPTPGPRVPAVPCPPLPLRAPHQVPASQPCRAHPWHYGPHAGSPRPSRAVRTPGTTGPTPGLRVPAVPCPPLALRAPRRVPASQLCRAHPWHYGPHAGSPRPSRAVPTPGTMGPTPDPRVPAVPCPPLALRAPRQVPASQPCRAHPWQ